MNHQADITIAIVAYNAEATLERCLKSARTASSGPILLVDDFSGDGTARMAANICGDQITIVQPAQKIGVGNARQTALENIQTPYAVWLDADDELLPHRVTMMRSALEKHDLVYDTCELIGEDGEVLARHRMPDFLEGPSMMRLFERNWLPGLFGAFRTDIARQIGYDTSFKNSEDYDFLLRALVSNMKIQLLDETGYRYHHSPTTLSRDIDTASSFTGKALAKHDPDRLQKLFERTGLPPAENCYLLACHAASTGDNDRLIAFLGHLPGDAIPIAPYGRPAADLIRHLVAVALMSSANWQQAFDILSTHPLPAAEYYNNLGVCRAQMGDRKGANLQFKNALRTLPGYLDATLNLQAEMPDQITRLPLRPKPIRGTYT